MEQALTTLASGFKQLPEPVRTTIAVIGAGAGVFLMIAGAIGLVAGPIRAFMGAMGALLAPLAGVTAGSSAASIAIGLLTRPIGIAVAAIAAFGIAYQTNFLGFADAVILVAGNIQSAHMPAFMEIQGTITALTTAFQALHPLFGAGGD